MFKLRRVSEGIDWWKRRLHYGASPLDMALTRADAKQFLRDQLVVIKRVLRGRVTGRYLDIVFFSGC